MKFKLYLFLIFQVLSIQILVAQNLPSSYYRNLELDSTKSNTLSFCLENSNFLKNNEYFNKTVQGYTLIGWFANPKLVYYPAKNVKIETGVSLLKYSGINGFTKVLPTLSVHYKINKSIDVIIGSLYGTTNHNLIEPLFRYEYFFTDNDESGLQFLFNTKRYKGDIWINWQDFIFPGDDKQEVFTLCLSNRFILSNTKSQHQFSVPVQILFVHHGGQINKTAKSLQTINNDAIGLTYKYFSERSFIKSIGAEQNYLIYKDMSFNYQFPYILGYGLYSRIFASSGNFQAQAAWWYGDHYISVRGNPMFRANSSRYSRYFEKQRALVTTRLMYEKEAIKGMTIGTGFEVFFDLYNQNVDYWYMFNINFNRDFFLMKLK